MQKQHNLLEVRKRWNCLKDLYTYLKESCEETVVSFNGHELITDKYRYTLAFGQLLREEL